jgi:hypothetical protein
MKFAFFLTLALPISALSLSACASKGSYPSLNPRPIEAQAAGLLTEPDAKSPVQAASDPAIVARIDAAVRSAQASEGDFSSALAAAKSAVATAGPMGSESWISGQMAVSALDKARGPVKTALAELDALLRQVLSGAPSEDQARVETAIRSVGEIDARQASAHDALRAAISR